MGFQLQTSRWQVEPADNSANYYFRQVVLSPNPAIDFTFLFTLLEALSYFRSSWVPARHLQLQPQWEHAALADIPVAARQEEKNTQPADRYERVTPPRAATCTEPRRLDNVVFGAQRRCNLLIHPLAERTSRGFFFFSRDQSGKFPKP